MLTGEYYGFLESNVGKQPRLEAAHEAQLWQRWKEKQDERARAEILEGYLPLCRSIAIRYAQKNNVSAPDLFGEAQLEMTRVFPSYDPDNQAGVPFAPYLVKCLHGRMLEFINRNSGPVKLYSTEPLRYLFSHWGRFNDQVVRQDRNIGDHARQTEIAKLASDKHPGITTEHVKTFEARLSSCQKSLNARADNDDSESAAFIDILKDERDAIAELMDEEEKAVRHQAWLQALENLSPRDREIMMARFPDHDEGEETLQALGEHFNLTKERVRQIEAKSLKTIQATLAPSVP